MQPGIERFVEIQRAVLISLRTMFVAGLEAFSAIHGQMAMLLKTFVEKSAESQQVGMKFVEDWMDNFRRAQVEFQKVVEESYRRADATLSGKKTGESQAAEKTGSVKPQATVTVEEAEAESPAPASAEE